MSFVSLSLNVVTLGIHMVSLDSMTNPRKALSRISARVLVLVSTLPLFARSKVR